MRGNLKIIEDFGDLVEKEGLVGIEVEMEGDNLPQEGCKEWKTTYDGSLRGYGSVEYVLREPVMNYKNALSALNYHMRHAGLQPSERCGVHIHINCQQLTVNQTFNFIFLYMLFEDILVRYCGNAREGNLFCLRTRDAEGLIDVVLDSIDNMSFNNVKREDIRYASININSLSKFGSLEFRALQTPDDVEDIGVWVDLLLCIYKRAKEIHYSRDIVEGFSIDGSDNYIRSLFGELADLLITDDIDELLYEGVRRIQYAAYEHSNNIGKVVRRRKKRKPEDRYKIHLEKRPGDPDEQPPEDIQEEDLDAILAQIRMREER